MDRDRLATLWWVGVAMNALSVGLSIVGWFFPQLVDWWALGVLGVLAAVAIGAVVKSRPRPFSLATPPRRRDEQQRQEATKHVLRGRPFTGPGPEAGDIDRSRRGLWSVAMQLVWWPLVATSWAFQEHGDVPTAAVVLYGIGTPLFLSGSIGGLIYLKSRRQRLDQFEDAELGLKSENASQ